MSKMRGGKSEHKHSWIWLIAVMFMIAILAGCGGDSSATDTEQPEEETAANDSTTETEEIEAADEVAVDEEADKVEEVKLTPQEEMIGKIIELIDSEEAFDAGSYIKGDIPEGEYAFIPFDGSGQYYSEEDANSNIIDNENFDSFGYVYVHAAGNITTDGVLINFDSFESLGVSSGKELFQIVNNIDGDYTDSAWYKVGVDIPAGEYVIESYDEGYVAIMSGPVGKNEIIDNEIFNGRYQVNVSEGQYLKVSDGYISE